MNLSPNIRAALFMMVSMTAFTVNDTFMKLASDGVPFFQSIFVRGLMITAGLLIYAGWRRHLSYRPNRKDWLMIGLRTFAEGAGTIFFLTALYRMPIANLSAILQALPLTVTLAAAVFLKEPVGWRRMVAILIGFVGVLLIIQPGTDGFTIYALYGVFAVGFVTLRDLSARGLSATIPSGIVALAAAVGVTAMAGVGSAMEGDWVPIGQGDLTKLFAASICLVIGYIAAVSAMRGGEIGFVAPFRYVSLVVSLIIGLTVFSEWPDTLTMVGAAIVVATGLFTLYRERQSARKDPIGVRIR